MLSKYFLNSWHIVRIKNSFINKLTEKYAGTISIVPGICRYQLSQTKNIFCKIDDDDDIITMR